MLTVDAHHHLWGNPPACARLDDDRMRSVRRPFTVAQRQAQLRAAEVDRSILVESGRCDEVESEDLLRWATEAPQIAGVVLWARAAAALPHVRFVLDHLGKPEIRAGATGLDRWRGPFAALAEQPNVTAKMSGLVTEADWVSWRADDLRPFVREALDRFGPDRLMSGSDWPLCLLAGSYGRVRAALHQVLPALSEAASQAIFGGTAGRVYRLGV
ncbi:amidohydrolase family protein [Micromonospora zamorensis]|uniref:amidohydrolase family protein n=1 Tax=Micromonospora zamorensis TaxID=709883 RepID=UPI00378B00FD